MTDLRGRVGARVKQLRTTQGLTQEQLAERSGLSYKFVGEIERGRGNPTLTTLAALSNALGVTLVDLLAVATERPRMSHRRAAVLREAISSFQTWLELESSPQPRRRRRQRS